MKRKKDDPNYMIKGFLMEMINEIDDEHFLLVLYRFIRRVMTTK